MNRFTFFLLTLFKAIPSRLRWLSLCVMLLVGQMGFAQTATIGTGTNNSDGTTPDPIDHYYKNIRYQIVYTAAELTDAGMVPYNELTGLGWSVTELPGTLANYTIRIGHTSATNSASHDASDLTEVRNAADYVPTVTAEGVFDMISFDANFVWNGMDNIVVDICTGSNAYGAPHGGVRTHVLTSGSRSTRSDGSSQCSVNTSDTHSYRPNIQFSYIEGTPPSCLAVAGLTASGITSNSANLSWTSAGSLFDIKYGVGVFDPETDGTPVNSVSNPYTLGSLAPSTSYSVYVRQDCGGEDYSAWSGPVSFTTACIASGDFTESFDTTASGDVPNCWSVLNENTTGTFTLNVVSNGNAPSAPNDFQFANSGNTNAELYLVSPVLNNLTDADHQLSFFYKGSSYATLQVGTMSDPSNAATFTSVESMSTTTGYDEYTVLFDQSYSDTHLAFKVTFSSTYYRVYLDDVNWEPIPSCLKPTDLAVDVATLNTADISWTASASAPSNGYEYAVTTSGTPPASGTNTSATSVSGVLVSQSVENYLHVRADCDGDGFSAWETYMFMGPTPGQIGALETTSTDFPIYTCYGYNYSQQLYYADELTSALEGETYITKVRFYYDGSGTTTANWNDWTIYMANTSKTEFVSNTDWVAGAELSQVFTGIITVPAAGNWMEIELTYGFMWDGTSNLVIGIDENASSYSCTAKFGAFNDPSGTNRSILYYSDGTNPDPASPPTANKGPLSIVNTLQLETGTPPTCPAPTALTVDALTTNTADISWTLGDAETAWNVVFGATGFDPDGAIPTSVTPDSNTTLTGLSANTTYEFYVQADCDGEESDWVGPVSFTTPCDALDTFPFTETFEDDSQSLDCWTLEYVTATQNWGLADGGGNSVSSAHNGTSNALFRDPGDNGNTTKLISPTLDFSTQDEMNLTFWYSNEEWFGSQSELRVYYKTSSGGTWTLIPGAEYTSSVTVWTEVELSLPSSANANEYYIAFEGVNQYSYGITLDDITIAAEPLCTAPTLALVAQDVNENPITECIDEGGEYYVLATLAGGEGNASYNVTANGENPQVVLADGSYTFGPFTVGTEVTITAQGVQDGACSVSEAISPAMCVECINTSSYGSADVSESGVQTVSTCNYLQEYSTISGIVSGYEYQFTGAENSSGNLAFITVRSGTYNGPIIGSGMSPVNVIALNGDNLFVHWNTNAECGTSSVCSTTTAECITCVPGFVYEDGSWTPSDPSVDAGPTDDIFVMNGETSFTSAIEVNNITVMSGATLNVESVLTINGDIINDGNLVFVSTATGNGELAAVPGTSTITGDVTVQRYMQSQRSYRMVSPAVTTTGSIHSNWQEGADNSADNPAPGFGTHITGSTSGLDGFDATITGNASMFTVNVATQQFEAIANTNANTLTAGEGYLLFVRGDRSIDLTNDLAAGETVLRATGTLTTGTNTQDFTTATAGNFVLFGNPYQSAVDVATVFGNSTNVNTNHYYVYNPSMGTHGAYVTASLPLGNNAGDPGDLMNYKYLQPGQAAQAEASGAAIVLFNESDKAPGNFSPVNRNPMAVNDRLAVQLYTTENFNNGGSVHDSFAILFGDGNNNGLTPADAVKPMNFYENLGVNHNGKYLSIEQREMPQVGEVYALYSSGYQYADYTLKMIVDGLEANFLFLDDNFTGTSTLLETGANTYSFSVDANNPLSIATDRFTIRTAQRLGVDDNSLLSGIRLFPNPLNGDTFYINAPKLNGEQLSVSISDLTGRSIYEQTLDCRANTVTVPMGNNVASGVYIVTLKNGGDSQTYRLIKE